MHTTALNPIESDNQLEPLVRQEPLVLAFWHFSWVDLVQQFCDCQLLLAKCNLLAFVAFILPLKHTRLFEYLLLYPPLDNMPICLCGRPLVNSLSWPPLAFEGTWAQSCWKCRYCPWSSQACGLSSRLLYCLDTSVGSLAEYRFHFSIATHSWSFSPFRRTICAWTTRCLVSWAAPWHLAKRQQTRSARRKLSLCGLVPRDIRPGSSAYQRIFSLRA